MEDSTTKASTGAPPCWWGQHDVPYVHPSCHTARIGTDPTRPGNKPRTQQTQNTRVGRGKQGILHVSGCKRNLTLDAGPEQVCPRQGITGMHQALHNTQALQLAQPPLDSSHCFEFKPHGLTWPEIYHQTHLSQQAPCLHGCMSLLLRRSLLSQLKMSLLGKDPLGFCLILLSACTPLRQTQ
jgi:hypothetical protein